MKLTPLLLLGVILAVSGWAQDAKPERYEPYSPEMVKKAEAGYAKAQFSLGLIYYSGSKIPNGLTQDYKEAVKWWTKSAEQGNVSAFKGLELMLKHKHTQSITLRRPKE